MSKINYKKSLLASLIANALFFSTANAADFYFGEDNSTALQISSQISFGASWRTEKADPRFIALVNGGTGATPTTDDGNLNFDKGDTFSKIVKGVHDLKLTRDNVGAFVRVKYWYDKELKDESRPHGNYGNQYIPGTPLSDRGFADYAKFSGIALMDAYVFGDLDIADMPVNIRLGRQVISWGESTFIQGGINSVNPIDVSAFRRPGAELKEGLLPVGMLYFNAGLTDNLSIEGFYQYEWEKTQIDGCGTLFSAADFAADGCNAVTVALPDRNALAGGFYAKRQADLEPDNRGQFGLAARYIASSLNETEFGVYFLNIHSRLPMINAVRTRTLSVPGVTSVFIPEALDPTGGVLSALNPGYLIGYPEDQKYYGISIATNLGGLALSGEISFKPDTPIQINGPEILNATLSENPAFRFTPRLLAADFGSTVKGYDEFDVTQIQITALQFYDRVLGASRLTLIGEAGLILTDGVSASGQRYGRNAVFGLGDFDAGFNHPQAGFRINCANLLAANAIAGDCRNDGYVTNSAWGYRLRASLDYNDLLYGVSLTPSLAWSHDVRGYSPEPAQQFHQGSKSLGLSLEASYQQRYSATVSYTTFSGGSHNIMQDKDFISLSFGMSY